VIDRHRLPRVTAVGFAPARKPSPGDRSTGNARMAALEQRFVNHPGAPRDARAWVGSTLRRVFPADPQTDDLVQDALIIVSELVTNAVRCGATEGVVTLHLAGGYVDIGVTDNGEGWPRLRDPSSTDTHGRGLLVVTELAATVAAEPIPGGKRVWATLAVDPALTARIRFGGDRSTASSAFRSDLAVEPAGWRAGPR
jgi:anti-sigma regulatory factor (Ser/Thr protein kinase)